MNNVVDMKLESFLGVALVLMKKYGPYYCGEKDIKLQQDSKSGIWRIYVDD